MDLQPQTASAVRTDEISGHPAHVVNSASLLNGQRELLIRHGEDTYRLRLTASNKLILTK